MGYVFAWGVPRPGAQVCARAHRRPRLAAAIHGAVIQGAICAALIASTAGSGPSYAQAPATPGLLGDGNAVVSGFSGARPPAQTRPGADPATMTTIDLNGPVLRVLDLQAPGASPQSQVLFAPKPFTITAGQIGQVFAIALDNATPPNVYAAATSVYGLPIVVPDVDKDGLPDRWEEGTAKAYFMPGLFGPGTLRGRPGSIWRIDGATGAVRLFANVALDGKLNDGPALGGLAFDPASRTLIVADRETGMIHRFDLTGVERGRYDHGTTGRRAAGLAPVKFAPAKRLSIKRPPFQPANPDSWGLAPPERRVFGLAVRDGRLYYAVAQDLQIWSVAIAPDGGFGSDARVEITMPPGPSAGEIAKIAFDDQGGMLLAERVAPSGAFDFAALTEEGGGRVLRYARAPAGAGAAWEPVAEEYAVGFAAGMRGGNGGVAVGYGYDPAGRLDPNACGGFVWATGEQLRASPDRTTAAELAQRGPARVNGLQGLALDAAPVAGAPPMQSYFVDFDDRFDDPKARGHMGDVVVFRSCARVAMAALPAPAAAAAPGPGVPAQQAPPLMIPVPIPPLPGAQPAPPGPAQVPGAAPPAAQAPVAGQPPGQAPAPPAPPGQPPATGQAPIPPAPLPVELPPPTPMQPAPIELGAVLPAQIPGQPPAPAAQPPVQLGVVLPAQIPGQPPAPPSASPAPAPAQPPGGAGVVVVPGVPGAPGAPAGTAAAPPAMGGDQLPPLTAGGAIKITKAGPQTCEPGKLCDFTITMVGVSPIPSGVFAVAEVPPPGWTFAPGASGANWSCASAANCVYNVTKHSQWPKAGISTGTAVLKTNVAFKIPANAKEGWAKNCVNATLPPAPGQSSKTIEVACADVWVGHPPKLAVTKKFDKSSCAPDELCGFTIVVKNEGKGTHAGFLLLLDMTDTDQFAYTGGMLSPPDWKCTGFVSPSATNTGQFACRTMGLKPGATAEFLANGKIKKGATEKVISNCAALASYGAKPDALDDWQKAALVREFLNYKGYPTKPDTTTGPLNADEQKWLASFKASTAGYTDAEGHVDVSGTITDQVIKSILPQIGDASGKDSFTACAFVQTKEPGLLVYKEPYKYPDWVKGHPTCEADDPSHPCGFTIKVSGRDEAPFTKPIQIEEQFPPGFWYQGFKTHGKAQWSCSGQYTKAVCTHPPANLTSKDLLEVTVFAYLSWENAKYYGYVKPLKSYPEITNCVKVLYDDPKQYDQEPKLPPAPGQVHPGRHWKACYKQKISLGPDFSISGYDATGSGPCYPPSCSYYDFTITSGDRPGRGSLTQRITPPSGSAMHDIRVIEAPPACPASRWSCTRTGAGPDGEFTCRIDDCGLAKGEQVITRLEGSVAPDLKEPPPAPIQKTACGALEWDAPTADSIEQQSSKQTKVACASIMVLARPPAPAAPVCAAGYVLLPSGLCCPTSQATASGQCCPWGQQPDAYGQTCVAVGPSAPPPTAQPQTQPWQTILPGLLQTMPGRTRPTQPSSPYPQPPAAPTPSVATPSSPPPAPSAPAQVLPTQPLQAAPAQPALQCTGGKVPVGGRCVCPSGTTEMRGLCVRPSTPSSPQVLQMQPGLLRVQPDWR